MTEIILDNYGSEYLKLELIEFKQKNNSFYIAKVKASVFLKIFTVRPAEYDLQKHTALASSFPDENDYYTHLINNDKVRINNKNFQREADEGRISKIQKFVTNEEFAFFPNTIISNCDLINDMSNYDIDENSDISEFLSIKDKPTSVSFLSKSNNKPHLYVPNKSNTVLVIDGQHRLEGLLKCSQDIKDNYDLIIAFIIGYDRSVIAKQFYTINYEQKSVNKSLLYQLTGEFSHNLDELTFMHNVAKLLNELTDSPFYGRIKMLGKAPKMASQYEKDNLSISQAFFIDSSLRLISNQALGTFMPPIFLKYYNNKEEHIHIIRAFARFFTAVAEIKTDWFKPKESVISKGMGVTALIRVLNIIFPKIFIEELGSDWSEISNLKVEDYVKFLKGLEMVDFSSNGPYGKTGSGGSITKIKNDILSNLNYISKPQNINLFEKEFQNAYTNQFNTVLKNAIK